MTREKQAALTQEQRHRESADDRGESGNVLVDQRCQCLFPSQPTHLPEHAATHHIYYLSLNTNCVPTIITMI